MLLFSPLPVARPCAEELHISWFVEMLLFRPDLADLIGLSGESGSASRTSLRMAS